LPFSLLAHPGVRTWAGIPGFLVAVKSLKDANSDVFHELMHEACFMAQLNCPYIVKLHGVVTVRVAPFAGLVAPLVSDMTRPGGGAIFRWVSRCWW
jgi:hypothetical protein